MNHEGFFSLRDFITLVELRAVRVLGIQSDRPGGVSKALKAIDYAVNRGLEVMIHKEPLGIAFNVTVKVNGQQAAAVVRTERNLSTGIG